jgi:phage tail-like protein
MARKPLFNRLPEIWRRLDKDEVLKRYLGVLDEGFNQAHDLAEGVLDFRSVDRVPDRYLRLLGDLVGHEWRSDKDHDWNRSRIRDAIRRYSYNGTAEAVKDLVREHGGGPCNIIDMASTLIVLDLQGDLATDNAVFEGDDYYHTGAFVLEITDQVNLPELKKDMTKVIPAGTRWYYRIVADGTVADQSIGISESSGPLESTNADEFALGAGKLDENLYLDFPPAGESISIGGSDAGGVFGGLFTMASIGFTMSDDELKMSAGSPGYPLPLDLALRCGTSEQEETPMSTGGIRFTATNADWLPVRFPMDTYGWTFQVISGTLVWRGRIPVAMVSLDENAAVENIGNGKVSIAATGHGLTVGDPIQIPEKCSPNLRGEHVLDAATDADHLVVAAPYVAEVIGANKYVIGYKDHPEYTAGRGDGELELTVAEVPLFYARATDPTGCVFDVRVVA